jgi:hypothetical protein
MSLKSISSAITVERCDWCDIYAGEKEDLIAEGVACEDMFPVLPRLVKQQYGPDIPKDDWWTVRRIRGGRFKVIREHEFRAPADPPIDAEDYRGVIQWNQRMLDVLLDMARGEVKNNPEHFHLANCEDVARVVCRLKDMLCQGPIVKRGRFSVIHGGRGGID